MTASPAALDVTQARALAVLLRRASGAMLTACDGERVVCSQLLADAARLVETRADAVEHTAQDQRPPGTRHEGRHPGQSTTRTHRQ